MVASIDAQNQAAQILTEFGLDVGQLPNTGAPGGNPDITINGQTADVFSPITSSPGSVQSTITNKVNSQASNIVINLANAPSSLTPTSIIQFIQQNPVSGLNNLYIIDKTGSLFLFTAQ
jgi:filamentous hemagglutinin